MPIDPSGLPGAGRNIAQSTTGNVNDLLDQVIPGLSGLTKSGTSIIDNMLNGLPSADQARTENAYFGVNSGMPGSEFVRNRGFDLYQQKANAQKQQGLGDLLSFIQGYSAPALQYRGQTIGQQESQADRGQRASQFGDTLGFEREQWNKSLELLPQLLGQYGGGPGSGVGAWGNVGGRPNANANDWSMYSNAYVPIGQQQSQIGFMNPGVSTVPTTGRRTYSL